MNFKYLTMFAAACAVGFSSCSSDSDDYSPKNNGQFDTSFTIALSNPATYGATSADDNASSYELGFNTVDIFVFSGNGTLESHTTRAVGDFTQVPGTDKWLLNDDSRIGAMTGDKLIYVGLNLPTDIAANIKQNGPKSENGIISIFDLRRLEGISMFNREEVKATLIEEDGTSAKNVVTVPVSRLLAKVLFFEKTADRVYDVKNAKAKASEAHFTVGNVNNRFFPLPDLVGNTDPNFDNEDMSTVFIQPGSNLDPYQAINLKGAVIKDSKSVYATENTITDGLVIQGAATYGIVRVIYKPDSVVTFAGGNLTPKLFTGTTFYLVRTEVSGKTVDNLFDNEANAKSYATSLPGGSEDDVITYTNGYAYYPVFLKDEAKAGASKYSVYRNTAYQVTINEIYGLGSHTDQPNDEPKGIIDPKDPIEQETFISVDIVINDWVMATSQETDLGK